MKGVEKELNISTVHTRPLEDLHTTHCCANILPHLQEIAVNTNEKLNMENWYYQIPVHRLNEPAVTGLLKLIL